MDEFKPPPRTLMPGLALRPDRLADSADFPVAETRSAGQTEKETANLVVFSKASCAALCLTDLKRQIEKLAGLSGGAPLLVMFENDNAPAARAGPARPGSAGREARVAQVAIRMAASGNRSFYQICPLSDGQHASGPHLPASQAQLARAQSPQAAMDLCRFTLRELDIIGLLRQGLANKIIAHHLAMAESTVKVHLRHIMRKLNAHNRTQAVFLIQRNAQVAGHG